MKTIKPYRLSISSRVVEGPGERCTLVLTGLLFVPLSGRALLTEQELWSAIPQAVGPDLFDEGYAKPKGEVVVWGTCYPPTGATTVSFVRVRIGTVDKRLAVIGDRHWQDGLFTEPTPFQAMPLDHAHAMGGAEVATNPLGSGVDMKLVDGRVVVPLPNVERPSSLLQSPSDRPEPALLRTIPLHWPQRMAKAGTYDEAWSKTQFPALARDMDLTWFQQCQEDQWNEGYFATDESFRLENLHPKRPVLEGTLPGFSVRLFVRKKDLPVFEAISRLETVHFLPDRERAVLVYRASVPVAEDDAAEVLTVLGAIERTGSRRDDGHYLRLMEMRERRELAEGRDALEEPELLPIEPLDDPTGLSEPHPIEEVVALDFLAMRNADRRKAREIENAQRASDRQFEAARKSLSETRGLSDDKREASLSLLAARQAEAKSMFDKLSTSMFAVASNPAEQDRLAREAEASTRRPKSSSPADMRAFVQEEMAAAREAAKGRLRAQMLPMLSSLPEGEREKVRELYEKRLEELDRETAPHPGLPVVPSEVYFGELEQAKRRLAKAGQPTEALEAQLGDTRLRKKFETLDEMAKKAHHNGIHNFDAPPQRKPAESRTIRDRLEHLARTSEPRHGLVAFGAELPGLQGQGLNLSESYFDGADLRSANLRGATLTTCIFARADLSGANLQGANLRDANLGHANLERADLSFAKLPGAILDGIRLSEAKLVGCELSLTLTEEADLRHIDFAWGVFTETLFYQCTFRGCSFRGANLEKGTIVECTFENCVFDEADLRKATFITCRFVDCTFRAANMAPLSALMGTVFERVSMVGARLDGACLRDARLMDVDLSTASLVSADLSGSDAQGLKLDAIDGRGLMAVRTNFSSASLSRADLMNAVLQKAKLHGTCLEEANLFQADMSRVRVDDKLSVKGANMGRVRLLPKAKGGPT